jgi:hypothetical protein
MVTSTYFLVSGISLAFTLIFGCWGCRSNPQNVMNPPSATGNPTVTASASPSAMPRSGVSRSGKFVNGEHPTKGTATVFIENGQWFVELDQEFSTSSNGPDLFVILHRAPDVIGSTKPPAYSIKSEDYVLVAPLGKFTGQQRYPIPKNIKPTEFKSVAIWCRQFNATFGAASLSQ